MIDKADHRPQLLYSTATSIHGSELREEHLLTEGLENYEKRAYYVVRHWVMIDVILPNDASEAMYSTSEHPTIVYAVHAKKYEKGCFVDVHKIRTSYQVNLDRNFFETKDALYILMGTGIRQSMSAELVGLLDTADPAEI
jgi:hypothetical protein